MTSGWPSRNFFGLVKPNLERCKRNYPAVIGQNYLRGAISARPRATFLEMMVPRICTEPVCWLLWMKSRGPVLPLRGNQVKRVNWDGVEDSHEGIRVSD
jgi:hypothetical protein